MSATSYSPQSRRSSASSGSSDLQNSKTDRPRQPGRTSTASSASSTATQGSAVDALAREFPAPSKEIDLDEALAREPRKGTLWHYIKDNSREAKPPAPSKEAQAQQLAAAKKELLEASVEVGQLGIGRTC